MGKLRLLDKDVQIEIREARDEGPVQESTLGGFFHQVGVDGRRLVPLHPKGFRRPSEWPILRLWPIFPTLQGVSQLAY